MEEWKRSGRGRVGAAEAKGKRWEREGGERGDGKREERRRDRRMGLYLQCKGSPTTRLLQSNGD